MVRKTIEELDLLDDFLFQAVISHGAEGEEVCRIILNTILGTNITKVRVVPQKVFTGADTSQHGIRLDAYVEDRSEGKQLNTTDGTEVEVEPDIYDVEPQQTYEKESLPKRTRYYNALIDSKILDAGEDYQKLRRVVIIMIMPYDPFGADRMIYTIQNTCIEDPNVKYDDGCKKIFLYTKGQASSQSLKEMLEYIQNSDAEHVKNQDVEKIHRVVSKVRKDKEVSISYMKSWERDKMMRKEGEARLAKLIEILQAAGRTDDILHAAQDAEAREKLYKEYNLE